MAKQLESIDSQRCQAEMLGGSFITFGPRSYIRCSKQPRWVAFDIRDGGFYGAMSLCDECKKVCEIKLPSAEYQPLV